MRAVPGCLNFNLLKEAGIEGDAVYVAMTEWENEAAFHAWTESDAFRRAHANAGNPARWARCMPTLRSSDPEIGLRTEWEKYSPGHGILSSL